MRKKVDRMNIIIGQSMKLEREKAGKTIEWMAEQLNKSKSTVSRWENGICEIAAIDMISYLDVLFVDIDDFIERLPRIL